MYNFQSNKPVFMNQHAMQGVGLGGMCLETMAQLALKGELDNVVALQRNFKSDESNTICKGKVNLITKEGTQLDGEVFNSKNQLVRKSEDVKNSSGPIGRFSTAEVIDPNVIVQMKPDEDFASMVGIDAGFSPFMPTRTFMRFAPDDFGYNGITEDMYFTSGDELRATKTLQQKTDSISISRRYLAFGIETNLIQDAESRARSQNYLQGAALERFYEHQTRLANAMEGFNQEMVNYVLFGDKAKSNVGSMIKPITAVSDSIAIDGLAMAKDLEKMDAKELVEFANAQIVAYSNGTGLNSNLIPNVIIMPDYVLTSLMAQRGEWLDATTGSIVMGSKYDAFVKPYNDILAIKGETLQVIGSQYLRSSVVNRKTSEGTKNLYIFTRKRTNPTLQNGIFFDLPIAPTLLNSIIPYNSQLGIKRNDIVIAQLGQVFAPRGSFHKVYKPVA